jgi:hypothetical protein
MELRRELDYAGIHLDQPVGIAQYSLQATYPQEFWQIQYAAVAKIYSDPYDDLLTPEALHNFDPEQSVILLAEVEGAVYFTPFTIPQTGVLYVGDRKLVVRHPRYQVVFSQEPMFVAVADAYCSDGRRITVG